ncbi:MAG: hypothetical protein ACRDTZ_06540 [Pseudonocardiaceae bacterium]
MPPKDVDAIAVWDAKARTLIDRIDAFLPEEGNTVADVATDDPLDALVHRVIARTPPPAGEILSPRPTNMGPQPDRIDPWDAHVCRFDSDGPAECDRPTP